MVHLKNTKCNILINTKKDSEYSEKIIFVNPKKREQYIQAFKFKYIWIIYYYVHKKSFVRYPKNKLRFTQSPMNMEHTLTVIELRIFHINNSQL